MNALQLTRRTTAALSIVRPSHSSALRSLTSPPPLPAACRNVPLASILSQRPFTTLPFEQRLGQLRTLPSQLRLFRNPDKDPSVNSTRHKEEKVEKETMASRTARQAKESRDGGSVASNTLFGNVTAGQASLTGEATARTSLPPLAVNKPLWQRVKDEAIHYWHGFKLLGLETRISTKLVYKLLKGSKLSRREARQLRRTTSDLLRLVPFLVFILVPFMEFLLPVFIKLFPNMLPSTFEDKFLEETKKKKLLKVRLEVADFLQDTIGEISIQGKPSSVNAAKEFSEFFRKIRTTGELASAKDISKVAKLFKDDITLDNLSRPQLVSMCRYMNLNAFGTDNFLRFQIRNQMRRLENDDKLIQAEGVAELTIQELQQACMARGIRTLGVSPGRLRDELAQWLDLHLNHKIPSTLLILSRAFTITDKPSPDFTHEALQATLSSLPDQLVNVAELQVSEVEGGATYKQKFDVIEQQEELIADELEQEAKEEAARKETKEAEERGRKESRETSAMDVSSSNNGIKDDDPTMSEEQMKDLREALSVLSSKSSVVSERVRLAEIIEDREEYKEDIEELKEFTLTESKVSSRLGARLEKLISKIDKELEQYDTEVGTRLNILKANEEGAIRVTEVEEALKLIRHNPGDERIKSIVAKLDADGDGLVFLHDINAVAQETEGLGVLVEDGKTLTTSITSRSSRESLSEVKQEEIGEDRIRKHDP